MHILFYMLPLQAKQYPSDWQQKMFPPDFGIIEIFGFLCFFVVSDL